MPAEHVAVISRDGALAAEIRRLAALAGRTVLVAGHRTECVRACRTASLVVVDAEAFDAVDETVPMSEVIVVTGDLDRVTTWETAVRLGARRVLALPAGTAELLDLIALAGERPGPLGPVIGVVAGRGGAGASVLAVALGWAFVRAGRPTTVVDFDPRGGGLDVLVGLERADGVRWPDLSGARGVVAAAALRAELPSVDGLSVLSTGKGSQMSADHSVELPDRDAVAAVLAAARRGGDVVVADLPRRCDEIVGDVVARCDVLLLVVPADVRAVAAAARVGAQMQSLCADTRLVLRVDGRRRLHERDVAAALGLQHVATLNAESGLTAAVDRGEFIDWLRKSGLGRNARGLVERLLPGDLEQAS